MSRVERTADAIVVLGARVLPSGEPSGALRARVERGVELFHQGAAPWLVLTGGAVMHPMPEAQLGQRLAIELGVPAERCLVEAASRSTRENAVLTARLLRERRLERVLLVTDPFHLFRATRHFWREGIDAVPMPTRWAERGLGLREHLLWSLRELPALLWEPRLLWTRPPPRGR